MEHTECPSPEKQRLREIEEAKAGVRPYVSRRTAAWYLGMHPATLSKLHSCGEGPRAVIIRLKSGPTAKKLYRLIDLDRWIEERGLGSEGSRNELAQLASRRREAERLQLKVEVGESRQRIRYLKRRLKRQTEGDK